MSLYPPRSLQHSSNGSVRIEVAKALIEQNNISSLKRELTLSPWLLNENLTWEDSSYTGTLLHFAAFVDRPDMVEFLVVEMKLNVNSQEDGWGDWTPLHHAEEMNAHRAAAKLLDLGADPTIENENEMDTISFSTSKEVKIIRDPDYIENEKKLKLEETQKKYEGAWSFVSPKVVVHDYELPDMQVRLTDEFNFETRKVRSIARDLKSNSISQTIEYFDDIPDLQFIHYARERLRKLGGDADEASISKHLNKLKTGLPSPNA